jgi:hypothetical protein
MTTIDYNMLNYTTTTAYMTGMEAREGWAAAEQAEDDKWLAAEMEAKAAWDASEKATREQEEADILIKHLVWRIKRHMKSQAKAKAVKATRAHMAVIIE